MTDFAPARPEPTSFWRRALKALRDFDEAMHIREADLLAERIRRLETDVAALKAAHPSSKA